MQPEGARVPVETAHAQLMDGHLARLHLLLGDRTLAREVVHALAVALDRGEDRRPLLDVACEGERRLAQVRILTLTRSSP